MVSENTLEDDHGPRVAAQAQRSGLGGAGHLSDCTQAKRLHALGEGRLIKQLAAAHINRKKCRSENTTGCMTRPFAIANAGLRRRAAALTQILRRLHSPR